MAARVFVGWGRIRRGFGAADRGVVQVAHCLYLAGPVPVALAAMANRRRKAGSTGRVTPKGGAAASPPARPAKAEEPVQVGRRPSSSGFLLLVGVMWLAVGVVMIFTLTASWRFVPGIVSLGIGLMFLRGAGATELRRERRRSFRK
jgi:hypothetical protein